MLHRIIIVDDRLPSRKGLRALLLTQPDIQVVGEAANGRQAIQIIQEKQPDVVLMDLSMPVMDGVEATREIKKKWSRMRVVILTLYEERREESLAAGADGFLVKGCPPEELFRVLKNQRKDKNVRKS